MAKAAPAFQFYAQDFIAGTMAMSAAARGCYISMLASAWVNGPIADTPRSLAAAMCLTPFDPPFAELWAEIAPKWESGPTGWTNAKLEQVRAEQQVYRDKQAEKGRKSAAHRSNSTGAQPEGNHGSTVVQPSTQPDTQPDANPSAFDLQSLNLELRTSPSPEREYLPEPAEIERHMAGDIPAEIAVILSKPAFDRTNAENDALAKHRGVELLPLGSRPVRQSQQSIAYREVTCRKHYGQGALPSCHRGICVPAFLGGDWEQQCGGDSAYVRQFIADVCRDLSGPVGDDPLAFWRAQWKAKHGSLVPREPRSNGERTVDAANRLAAKYKAEGRL